MPVNVRLRSRRHHRTPRRPGPRRAHQRSAPTAPAANWMTKDGGAPFAIWAPPILKASLCLKRIARSRESRTPPLALSRAQSLTTAARHSRRPVWRSSTAGTERFSARDQQTKSAISTSPGHGERPREPPLCGYQKRYFLRFTRCVSRDRNGGRQDGGTTGATVKNGKSQILSRTQRAWWPVLTCRSVGGFPLSTEGARSRRRQ